MDLILVIIFSYQLHRMATEKGVSSAPYILHYIATFLLVAFALGVGIVKFYGADWLNNPEAVKTATMFAPFTLLFEIVLFLYFRSRIQKVVVEDDNDEESFHPDPPKEKKDLSYFR